MDHEAKPAHEAKPLAGVTVVSIATNLPGPYAAARFCALGAHVTKVEPPAGDYLAQAVPAYYRELAGRQRVMTLDLKSHDGAAALRRLLADADLLITSHRPAALERLGLDAGSLRERFPRLCGVAIVGESGGRAGVPGHDLTYQASAGILQPPSMPTVLVADLAGAERAVAEGLAALLWRERTGEGVHREVALSEAARSFAAPARHGMTSAGGPLSGALPQYALYRCADGYVALAALESHFWGAVRAELPTDGSPDDVARVLATRTGAEWEEWAHRTGIPLAAVRPL